MRACIHCNPIGIYLFVSHGATLAQSGGKSHPQSDGKAGPGAGNAFYFNLKIFLLEVKNKTA
jgi:hypothetical protein